MGKMRVFAVACVAFGMFFSGPAGAAPERTATVVAGQSWSWQGATETNANPYYFRVVGSPAPAAVGPLSSGTCNADPYHACDDILVELSNPLTQAEIDKGLDTKYRSVMIQLTELTPNRVADFDFQVFQSDANGTKYGYWTGKESTSQAGDFQAQTGGGETLTVDVETTTAEPSKWMLIRVIRFLSPNSSYKGTVSF
jgi:hypothetical protein